MKGLLDRWFNKDTKKVKQLVGDYDRPALRARGVSLTVYDAHGGKVVQVEPRHNPMNAVDFDSFSNLYIVPKEEDLGEQLGQIITRELLAR